MKYKATIIIFFLMTTVLLGQPDTSQWNKNDDYRVIINNVYNNGGYLAFTITSAPIINQSGLCSGARAGWLINHRFATGVAGYVFFNDPSQIKQLDTVFNYNFRGGYLGIFIEPVIAYRSRFHVCLPVMAGAGGVAFVRSRFDDEWHDFDYYDISNESEGHSYLFLKPGVELEINLMKYFRLNFGAYYRITTDINFINSNGVWLVEPNFLNGLSYGISFKFGKF